MHAKLLLDSRIFSEPIGIGTILATVILGPDINFFHDRMVGYYEKMICEDI